MNEDQYSAFLAAIMPGVIHLVAEAEQVSEDEAAVRFYSSRLYEKLSDEHLKVWHYSPQTLCAIYMDSKENGRLTFPEEAC